MPTNIEPARGLQVLGLSELESRVYAVLAPNGATKIQGVADALGVTRPTVYPAIRSLSDKGLVEVGAGHGARVRAVPPGIALPALVERRRKAFDEEQRLVEELVERFGAERGQELEVGEFVEVSGSPRALAERHRRLQEQATKEVLGFIKAPFFVPDGDPGGVNSLARGVRHRGVFEQAALEATYVRANLERWVVAGEEIRVFDGSLPMKFVLVDDRVCLFTLGERSHHVVVNDAGMGSAFRILFDTFWERSIPLEASVGSPGPTP